MSKYHAGLSRKQSGMKATNSGKTEQIEAKAGQVMHMDFLEHDPESG